MNCGTCTLCCVLPPLKEIGKLPGEICKYCSNGCTIYSKRPNPCREFECAYMQASKADISLRPDKSGIIFEKITDNILVGTLNPIGHSKNLLQGQIKSFIKEGLNVIILYKGIPTVYHQEGVNPTGLLEILYTIAKKI